MKNKGSEKTTIVTTSGGVGLEIHTFDSVDYLDAQQCMQAFCSEAHGETPDQIWLLQHPSVYTQGTACELNTLLPSNIPVVQSDRGGQITYHGPGQIVMYPMLNLRRHGLSVKSLVSTLEQSVINLLADLDITGLRKDGAPGIYVQGEKIAALGLRIRRGWSYHGLSLNVDMDLTPFDNIDPCGYVGLRATQLSTHRPGVNFDPIPVGHLLVNKFSALL